MMGRLTILLLALTLVIANTAWAVQSKVVSPRDRLQAIAAAAYGDTQDDHMQRELGPGDHAAQDHSHRHAAWHATSHAAWHATWQDAGQDTDAAGHAPASHSDQTQPHHQSQDGQSCCDALACHLAIQMAAGGSDIVRLPLHVTATLIDIGIDGRFMPPLERPPRFA